MPCLVDKTLHSTALYNCDRLTFVLHYRQLRTLEQLVYKNDSLILVINSKTHGICEVKCDMNYACDAMTTSSLATSRTTIHHIEHV